MILTVLLPLLLLGVAAWAIPLLLARILPEGLAGLALNGAVSTLLLAGLSALGFYLLYGAAGDRVLDVAPWYFLLLSARAALVWAPVMVLSLANVPGRWTRETW